jgi:hypothetical protein
MKLAKILFFSIRMHLGAASATSPPIVHFIFIP